MAIDIHIKKIVKHETHDSYVSLHTSILETENFAENLQHYCKNETNLISNKENLDYKEFSDKKSKKKSLNESRTSLKNISFRELFNDVNNKLSATSKNNFPLMPFNNKISITSNKHINLLSLKTPRTTAFYSSKDNDENINDKTIIKSPLYIKEHELKDHL